MINKMIKLIVSVFVITLAFSAIVQAQTLEEVESFIENQKFYELMGNTKSVVSKKDAGVESINKSSGNLMYSVTDLVLPGKGGLDFTVKRKFNNQAGIDNAGNYSVLNITTRMNVDTRNKGNKYVFKYTNVDTEEIVYVAYNSISDMLRVENGTNAINISGYTLKTVSEAFPTEEDAQSAIVNNNNIGFALSSNFCIADDLNIGSIRLVRDASLDYAILQTESIHTYIYTTKSRSYGRSIGFGWVFDETELEITQIKPDGHWFVAAGTFYDSSNGVTVKFEVTFFKDQNDKVVSNYEASVFSYREFPDEYNSVRENSYMYKITMNKDCYFHDLAFTIRRYDGVIYNIKDFTGLCSIKDRYNNEISFQNNPYEQVVTDTLGREIRISSNGIFVNDKLMVSYEQERNNNDFVDENDRLLQDDECILYAKYQSDSINQKIVKYGHRNEQDVHIVKKKNVHYSFDQSLATNGYRLNYIELSTGGKINYKGEPVKEDVLTVESNSLHIHQRTDMAAYKYYLTSRYETLQNDNTPINKVNYDYNHDNLAAKETVTTYTGLNNYQQREIFNYFGYVTNSYTTSNDTDNQYYIEKNIEYTEMTGEGNYLPKKVTTTTKRMGNESISNTVIEEYKYNQNQQKTEVIRDGQTIEWLEYYHDKYYQLMKHCQKRGENDWLVTYNTPTTDSKNIARSYPYKKTNYNVTITPQSNDECIVFSYTANGDLESKTEKKVTTNYHYDYTTYNATNLNNDSLIKTISINDVGNITNDYGDGNTTEKLEQEETYDMLGRLRLSKDAKQNPTKYEYDIIGRPTKATFPDGSYATTQYDDVNNTVISTDETGIKEKVVFDAIGRQDSGFYYISDSDSWFKVFDVQYDVHSRPETKTVYHDDGKPKSAIKYDYYDDNQTKSEEVVEYTFSIVDGVTVQDENTLSKKEFLYDPLCNYDNYNQKGEVKATTKVYDKYNSFATVDQYKDKYGYKLRDNLTYYADDSSKSETQTYVTDLLGNVIKFKDFKANSENSTNYTAEYEYDQANRLIKTKLPNNQSGNQYAETHIDQWGRVDWEKDYKGNTTSYLYNNAGQLIQISAPIEENFDAVTKKYYDKTGNLSREEVLASKKGETTPKYNSAKHIYDNRNRLKASVQQAEPNNIITKYEYDDAGRVEKMALGLSSVEEEINNSVHSVTQYDYDNLGNLEKITDPLNKPSHYKFNMLGELERETDRNGGIKTYTYDGLSRVKTLTASYNGLVENTEYSYNYMGKISTMIDNLGNTVYTYNSRGELEQEKRNDVTKKYTYDANSNPKSFEITGPSSYKQNVIYTFDWANRLKKASDGNITDYTYDPNGNLMTQKTKLDETSSTYFRDVVYSYNKANMLTSKTTQANGNTVGTYTDLIYYANGNLAEMKDNGRTKTYEYDSAGRLKTEVEAGQGKSEYLYDQFSNRDFKTVKDNYGNITSLADYNYDRSNRLLEEAVIIGDKKQSTQYVYDNNGNQIMKMFSVTDLAVGDELPGMGISDDDILELYSYDPLNRLKSMKKGSLTANYTYDGTRLRQSKTVGGVTTKFVYNGSNIVMEDIGGTIVKYSRGLELISRSENGDAKNYYHQNNHGDVIALTNDSGFKTVDYSYDAFGNQKTTPTQNDNNPFRYCGEYQDSESGLIYLRARYYDPGLGRFISEDPIRDGLNWYAYANNNPIMFVDPSGLSGKIIDNNQRLFDELKLLTDDELSMDENGKVWIEKTNSGSKGAGTELVRRILWNNENQINIAETNGKSNFDPTTNTAYINFNEPGSIPLYTDNGSGSTMVSMSTQPVFITIAHELIHADHWIRGVYEYQTPTNYEIFNLDGEYVYKPNVKREEIKTVGPIKWEEDNGRRYRDLNGGDITENDIRWENHKPLRSGW